MPTDQPDLPVLTWPTGQPVLDEGRPGERWEILNVLTSIACLDETLSHFRRAPDGEGYSSVDILRCDEESTRGHDLFMVRGRVVLIASDRLRSALEGAEVTGRTFTPV
jgi:hypothetical protein